MGLLSAARQRADQHAGGSGAELPPLGRYSDVAPSAPPLPTSGYGGGGGSTRRAPLYPHDAYAPRPGAASSGGGVGGGTGGGGGAAYSKGAQWPLPAGDVATGYPVPDVPAGAAGSGLTTPAAGKPAEGVAAVLGRLAGLFGGRGGEGRERGRGWGWGRGRTAAAGQDVGPAAVSAEEGRRIMLEQRDMLFADASLFRINEHTGEVVAVVEGDALRLRLRSPDPRRGGSWGASSSRGGWGPAAGEEVVRLTVGDAACVDLNPPGAEPLPLLHAGPGVYTFRAGPGRLLLYPPGLGLLGLGPDSDGAYSGGSSGSGGEAEGDMKGAAWPVAPASSYPQVPYEPHQQHRHRHKRGGGEQAAAQDGGGDGYYYCLTVSPTICDSCGLDELDGVMAAYCRFSGWAWAGAGLVGGAG
ncbi:hypothetical protein HYH03_013281 [Edaphochlamys debaryana]|uniref:Uncharacterized protein n=1 Tax=Edaphochlamys debaryana TaxID=47281 RepID=A0A835XWJ0_9CHLO|nr:hypothetical protein HYH03_013281 [Edaphochlamys debaryana]|eukprot:KAG2488135.1 hypothetical protein HYH03_013281 [Edaphochlamys debaryana]